MGKHKNYDVIVAAAEGKEIQWRESNDAEWVTYSNGSALSLLGWNAGEYRIKPEVKYPETRMQDAEMVSIWNAKCSSSTGMARSLHIFASIAIRRAIQDGDVILPNKD